MVVKTWLRWLAGVGVLVASTTALSLDGQRVTGQATPGPTQPPPAKRGVVAAPDAADPLNAGADLSPKPPVLPLRPDEQATRFWLPPGYRLEPVLADPVIEDPGQVAFDGDGRMFVLELRGYEQTLDGRDLVPPIGRISVHEDRDDDGVYEHHRVFVDGIVFPRFVLPWGADSVLTMETHQDEIWKYTDTNGDGTADDKTLFSANFGRPGNIEHQPSSLFWAMDNWLYSTYNSFRMRWTPTGLVRESTGINGAQWGISQDNDGKLWFQGGASGMPGYFQFPVHYGNFDIPDRFEPDLNVMWGAPILVGDIQVGVPGTRMPDGSLIHATAGAGSQVYRGDRLPSDLVGDYLYGEVVARVVRRLRPVKTEGLTQLRNAYPLSEFIRSLDPLFRPVDVVTAPDGTLYIADMYRGIIEGAPWAKEGTYLRKKIEQYQLDRVRGYGRIWRLTYDGMPRDRTRPRMLQETPTQLVAHLSHPNGWWRDTAQHLIVLGGDRSVVPALQALARRSDNPLARVHALWTLEGLGALDAALVRTLLADPSPRIRVQAIRASETLYKAGDRSLLEAYRAAALDRDVDVVTQALLTLNLVKAPDLATTIRAAQAAHAARGVQHLGARMLEPTSMLTSTGRRGLTPEQRASLERGETAYQELCATCHAADGLGERPAGEALPRAPSLAASARVQGHRDYTIKAILHGLTGPIDGTTYAQVMVPMATSTDQWIADVASFIRNAFGNSASLVTAAQVAHARQASGRRATPWTLPELTASIPVVLQPDESWKATASHQADQARAGLSYEGWSSGDPQQPGMWFQIELPTPRRLAEIEFNSPTQGGGRGGPPATGTFPRGYTVQVSSDGVQWSAPVAEGQGAGNTTTIAFAPVQAKFVRITQSGQDGVASWTIQRLRVYAAPR